jgi:hypothetical protein
MRSRLSDDLLAWYRVGRTAAEFISQRNIILHISDEHLPQPPYLAILICLLTLAVFGVSIVASLEISLA